MRRLLLIVVFALASTASLAPAARGARYLSHRDGVRVTFRVQGSKVVSANVFARLYCHNDLSRQRYLSRFHRTYAEPAGPLHIDRNGMFRTGTPEGFPQEEGFTELQELVGHVGGRAITGFFAYSFSLSENGRNVSCQTGTYPERNDRVRFRAPLRSHGYPALEARLSLPRESRRRNPGPAG